VSVVVENIDNHPLPFPEAQQRSRKLAVIERGRDDMPGCQFDQPGSDAQRVIRLLGSNLPGSPYKARRRAHEGNQSGIFEQRAAIDRHGLILPQYKVPLMQANRMSSGHAPM
jgi:hypothetical protein